MSWSCFVTEKEEGKGGEDKVEKEEEEKEKEKEEEKEEGNEKRDGK